MLMRENYLTESLLYNSGAITELGSVTRYNEGRIIRF